MISGLVHAEERPEAASAVAEAMSITLYVQTPMFGNQAP